MRKRSFARGAAGKVALSVRGLTADLTGCRPNQVERIWAIHSAGSKDASRTLWPYGGFLHLSRLRAKSGWTDKLDKIAGHLAMITPQLMVKTDSKVRQLSAAPAGIPGDRRDLPRASGGVVTS